MMIFAVSVSAQKFKVVSGNFDFLKGEKQVDVEISIDNSKFQVENYSESEYTDKIKSTITANPKKKPEDLSQWTAKWEEYRNGGFADAFIKGANGKTGKFLTFGKNQGAKYKLIIDSKWIYAGWYGGMMMQPAKLSLEMKFVEAADPSKILLQLETDKLEGAANNKDLVWEYGRIAAAFESIGKQIGAEIKSNK